MRELLTIAVAAIGCPACGIEIVSANAATQTPAAAYAIDAHIVASGSSVTSSNACYRLRATIGEPVVGYATNAGFVLSVGFRAVAQDPAGDPLFHSGFEACP
ncbi:MAG TPA: hypothetical protein VM555_00435 [Tahibacter sp.]|nr:hypothetical protein [Tahibacter sp.]